MFKIISSIKSMYNKIMSLIHMAINNIIFQVATAFVLLTIVSLAINVIAGICVALSGLLCTGSMLLYELRIKSKASNIKSKIADEIRESKLEIIECAETLTDALSVIKTKVKVTHDNQNSLIKDKINELNHQKSKDDTLIQHAGMVVEAAEDNTKRLREISTSNHVDESNSSLSAPERMSTADLLEYNRNCIKEFNEVITRAKNSDSFVQFSNSSDAVSDNIYSTFTPRELGWKSTLESNQGNINAMLKFMCTV